MALATSDPETDIDGSHDDLGMSDTERSEQIEKLNSLYQGSGAASSVAGAVGGKRKSIIRRRVQYSLASTLIIAGLGLGGGAGLWMTGPGQLVMFAEIFKDFSLGPFERDQEDFSQRMARKLMFKDKDTGERRLSLAGRKMWRNMEGGLKKTQGLTFDTDNGGNLTGIRKNGELIRDLSDGATDAAGKKVTQGVRRSALKAELRSAGIGRFSYYTKYRPLMQTRFRVKFTVFENAKRKTRVQAREWYEKKFKKAVVEGDTDTAVVGQDEDTDGEDIDEDERQAREERNQQADSNADSASNDAKVDLDTESADIDAGNTNYEARVKSKGRLKLGAKGVMGFALIGCAVMSMSENVESLAQAQRAVPMIRIANQFFAAGDQVRSGDIGALEEVGEMTKLLHSRSVTAVNDAGEEVVEPAKTWIDAKESRMAVGAPWKDRPGLPEDMHPSPTNMAAGLDTVANWFKQIPGFGTICDAASSTIGTIVMTGVDLLGGPGSFLVGEALNKFVVGPLLERAMKYAAGPAFDLAAMGPLDFPGATMAGGLLSATNTALDTGGWLIDRATANENRMKHMERRRAEFAQRPVMDRIFDYSHPDSFITQATFEVPHNRQQVMLAISEAPKNFLSGIGSIVFPKVFAADDDCRGGKPSAACLEGFDAFGIEEAGWSQADKEKALTYEPDHLVSWYLGEDQTGSDCEGELGACESIYGKLDQDRRADLDKCFESGDEEKAHDFEGDGCDLFDGSSDEAIMFRAARMYVSLAEGYACANDEPDCPIKEASAPSTGTSPGEITDDSSGTPCAPGTEDYGIREDAYTEGNQIKIRLCGITSIPGFTAGESQSVSEVQEDSGKEVRYAMVSSIASEAWQQLGEAAQADSIDLRAGSSWRSMAHQEKLCEEDVSKGGPGDCPNGNYVEVAQPGHSNHQAGLAIDIQTLTGNADANASCENPQTRTSPLYVWLVANANRFGIKQYAKEAWHWGTAESCLRTPE